LAIFPADIHSSFVRQYFDRCCREETRSKSVSVNTDERSIETYLVSLTESMKLKIGHDFHIFEDEILVAVEELFLLKTVSSHEFQLVVVVESSEQHRMIRCL
jgi:hypothetical protein